MRHAVIRIPLEHQPEYRDRLVVMVCLEQASRRVVVVWIELLGDVALSQALIRTSQDDQQATKIVVGSGVVRVEGDRFLHFLSPPLASPNLAAT